MHPKALAALRIVNRVRKAVGDPKLEDLPKGYRGVSTSCPLANALPDDAKVGTSRVWFADKRSAHALADVLDMKVVKDEFEPSRPYSVRTYNTPIEEFVQAFDHAIAGTKHYPGKNEELLDYKL